jgi:hypothetical protein
MSTSSLHTEIQYTLLGYTLYAIPSVIPSYTLLALFERPRYVLRRRYISQQFSCHMHDCSGHYLAVV